MKKCDNEKCEDGWIFNGPVIGYIPCKCQELPKPEADRSMQIPAVVRSGRNRYYVKMHEKELVFLINALKSQVSSLEDMSRDKEKPICNDIYKRAKSLIKKYERIIEKNNISYSNDKLCWPFWY